MAFKQFALDERTTITIYKRKTNRSLRLSIAASGEIKVTIPLWAPYSAGLAFARSRASWIAAQQPISSLLASGHPIGKAHHLSFVATASVKAPAGRLRPSEAIVNYPIDMSVNHPAVQKAAQAVSIRALRSQAEALLPQRLQTLADRHGFTYKSVAIKRLKSRWGSCDTDSNIVLNLFLMQLPWECIDYVLLHELTHTRIMRHGPDFWGAMADVLPAVQTRRKTMRTYQPILQ